MVAPGESCLGRTIERYRLVRVLGAGASGTVYLGERVDDPQAQVAVKVLTLAEGLPAATRASITMRFLREARMAGRLRHEHILPVLSFGEAGGLTYMVMPVVPGTLAARLAGRRLPLEEVAWYLDQVAGALDFAHEHGVIHRDVKPSNVLVDDERFAYLADFGIARLFDTPNAITGVEGQGSLMLTRTGEVLGTAAYMAPEQIRGEAVGAEADVYALGVMVYLMVTGTLPFDAGTPLAVALQHLQDEPPPPDERRPDLPAAAADAILRALAKDPEERFPSATDLARAFARGAGVRPPRAPVRRDDATLVSGRSAAGRSSGGAGASRGRAGPASSAYGAIEPPAAYRKLVGTMLGSYRLEELLEVGALGPIFRAGGAEGEGAFRVRLLAASKGGAAETRSLALGRFEQEAHDVSALHQPHILPLVDYGTFRGQPYLVAPQPAGPSLTAVLDEAGPLDARRVGRYLDQMAEGLEYAHRRGVLHRNLTAACVYVEDGDEVALADFGARRMLELGGAPAGSSALFYAGEAYTPEQLLGGPVGTFTDVYALGAVVYQLLAGRPVFVGESRNELTQQHLHAAVPPLAEWRDDLPGGLDEILAEALAKEPERRLEHPGELARAYKRLLGQSGLSGPSAGESAHTMAALPPVPAAAPPARAARRPDGAVASAGGADGPAASDPGGTAAAKAAGGAGSAVATGVRDVAGGAGGAGAATRSGGAEGPGGSGDGRGSAAPAATAPRWGSVVGPMAVARATAGSSARWVRASMGDPRRRYVAGGIGAVLLLAIVLMVHIFTPPPPPPAVGEVAFLDGAGQSGVTNSLVVRVTRLGAAPAGSRYEAWMIDQQAEHFTALGALAPRNDGLALTFVADGKDGRPKVNLLNAGDHLEITLESGPAPAPSPQVVLSAALPPQSFSHIRHLLVAFDTTPGHVGLVVGLLDQAQLLDAQALLLTNLAPAGDQAAIQCLAQSIVDISEGAHGQHYAPLDPACAAQNLGNAGDGFGILGQDGYANAVIEHAALAAQQPDATATVKLHAGHVEIAANNIKGWVGTVDQDAVNLVNNPGDTSKVQEIATLSAHAHAGIDTNNDESIDPVPGEAGAVQAYEHAQLMAGLTLAPPR